MRPWILCLLLGLVGACDLKCPPGQARSAEHCECVWIQCAPGKELRWGGHTLLCTPTGAAGPCETSAVLMARDQHGRCLLVNTEHSWLATAEGLAFVTPPTTVKHHVHPVVRRRKQRGSAIS